MHGLDTLVLSALGVGAVLGGASGLYWQVARLVILALALVASIAAKREVVQVLQEYVARDAPPAVVHALAYAVIFLTVYLTLYLLARLIRVWLRNSELSWADRVLGCLFGAVKVGALLSLGCLLLRHSDDPLPREWLQRSHLAPRLADAAERTIALVPPQLKQAVLEAVRQAQAALSPTSPDSLRSGRDDTR
ncbi:MAG: CvpA family protein [Gemmataceae bacterium]|nr:CvpA family protein [Gemmataceae bacterium]